MNEEREKGNGHWATGNEQRRTGIDETKAVKGEISKIRNLSLSTESRFGHTRESDL